MAKTTSEAKCSSLNPIHPKGSLVALTGLDGVGKSQVAEELSRRISGSRVMKTPGEAFQGIRPFIDKYYLTRPSVHYQFYLASVINASEEAREQLQAGDVVMDRYHIDTVVYHRAVGLNVELAYETRSYSIRKPDLTVFLAVDEKVRRRRMEARGLTPSDSLTCNSSFRTALLKEFERLRSQFVVIETTERNVREIAEEILGLMRPN